ncbi:MAG: glycosyltransferase family 4 protein [Bacteroidetes bacterium]|nr:glycosyltransferase family 4 protein [Bacteroidota bacterium]
MKLGFKEQQIRTGFYSADTKPFHRVYNDRMQTGFAKRFICTGRLIELKGVAELIKAFRELESADNGWKLLFIGEGPLKDEVEREQGVTVTGFIQPSELAELYREGGVFVFPTHGDGWGVAVHEAAAAGMPLLLSEGCGAHENMLKDDENGYLFRSKDVESLKNAITKIMELNDEKLRDLGTRSFELSSQITPLTWSDTAWELLN